MKKTAPRSFRTICVSAAEPAARCNLFATEEDACCFAARAMEERKFGQVLIEKQNPDGYWECLEIHRTAL
ncbi:MAG TPA: hypothetical protein VGK90_03950 [Rhizomicrobium sp.]|jgi:hypothetical protein